MQFILIYLVLSNNMEKNKQIKTFFYIKQRKGICYLIKAYFESRRNHIKNTNFCLFVLPAYFDVRVFLFFFSSYISYVGLLYSSLQFSLLLVTSVLALSYPVVSSRNRHINVSSNIKKKNCHWNPCVNRSEQHPKCGKDDNILARSSCFVITSRGKIGCHPRSPFRFSINTATTLRVQSVTQ